MRDGGKDKPKINMLLNIDNYFGDHQGRLGPILIYLVVVAAPFLLYVLTLSQILPLKWVLIFEVIFAFRMALFILGRENEKLDVYLKSRDDEYANSIDLVRIKHIRQEDGLIEYANGNVAYIISAMITTYDNDDVMADNLQAFLDELSKYSFDIYLHNVVHEHELQEDLSYLKIYHNKRMMHERMQFIVDQDQYYTDNTKLYRINFLVKASKYSWKQLKEDLQALISTNVSKVFRHVYLCDYAQVTSVMSRDICAYIDINELLTRKYGNDDYGNSEVLFYGEEVPEMYTEIPEDVGIENRRVIND